MSSPDEMPAFDARSEAIARAHVSIDAAVRIRPLSAAQRHELAMALGDAVRRGVKVHLLVDTHAVDRKFVSQIAGRSPPENLEVRNYVPLYLHLYAIDGTQAIRFLGFANPGARGPEVGVIGNDQAFARSQLFRFQSAWGDGMPQEASASRLDRPAPQDHRRPSPPPRLSPQTTSVPVPPNAGFGSGPNTTPVTVHYRMTLSNTPSRPSGRTPIV